MGKLSDYEKAKKNLEIKLCDKEENIEKLKQQVYTEHGDFAATYHIVMGELEGGKASVAVTPWLMKKWGIAVDQLHQEALKSDREKGATFMDMDFMVMKAMGFAPEPPNLLDTPGWELWNMKAMDLECIACVMEKKWKAASLDSLRMILCRKSEN